MLRKISRKRLQAREGLSFLNKQCLSSNPFLNISALCGLESRGFGLVRRRHRNIWIVRTENYLSMSFIVVKKTAIHPVVHWHHGWSCPFFITIHDESVCFQVFTSHVKLLYGSIHDIVHSLICLILIQKSIKIMVRCTHEAVLLLLRAICIKIVYTH